jgi:general secretion pathway protein G
MRFLVKVLIAVGALAAVGAFAFVSVRPSPWTGGSDEVVHAFVKTTARTALHAFRVAAGRFPTESEGLAALIHCPPSLDEKRWRGPYFTRERVPEDPWGNPFQYRCPGIHNPKTYDVWSLGPDGIESSDDIGNWESSEAR